MGSGSSDRASGKRIYLMRNYILLGSDKLTTLKILGCLDSCRCAYRERISHFIIKFLSVSNQGMACGL